MTSPPQTPGALKSSLSPHRFLSTQVGSAIISSEVWDETGEANTAVTFHLQHQIQVLCDASGKQPPGTVILVWCPPPPPPPTHTSQYLFTGEPRSKTVQEKYTSTSHPIVFERGGREVMHCMLTLWQMPSISCIHLIFQLPSPQT